MKYYLIIDKAHNKEIDGLAYHHSCVDEYMKVYRNMGKYVRKRLIK